MVFVKTRRILLACCVVASAAVATIPARGAPAPPPPFAEDEASPLFVGRFARVLFDNLQFQDSLGRNAAYRGKYRMWFKTAGGLRMAVSDDGIAWTDKGGVENLTGDVTAVAVVYNRSGFSNGAYFQIFYRPDGVASCPVPATEMVAGIRTAFSYEGKSWFFDQAVSQVATAPIVACADPVAETSGPVAVLFDLGQKTPAGRVYTLYYDGVDAAGRRRVFVASSDDGLVWRSAAAGAVLAGTAGAWDANAVTFGSVVRVADPAGYFFFYSGGSAGPWEGVGLATSDDGLAWSKHPGPFFASEPGSWRSAATFWPSVLLINDELRLWFAGGPTASQTADLRIGAASTGLVATPSPSPVPTASPTPTPSPSPSPTPEPSASPSPTPTPSTSPAPTPTPTPSGSPTPSPTPTPSPGPTSTPAPTASPSPSPSPTPSPAPMTVEFEDGGDGLILDREAGAVGLAGQRPAGTPVRLRVSDQARSTPDVQVEIPPGGTTYRAVLNLSSLGYGRLTAFAVAFAGDVIYGPATDVTRKVPDDPSTPLGPRVEIEDGDGIVSPAGERVDAVGVVVTHLGPSGSSRIRVTASDGTPNTVTVDADGDAVAPGAQPVPLDTPTRVEMDFRTLRDGPVTVRAVALDSPGQPSGQAGTILDRTPPVSTFAGDHPPLCVVVPLAGVSTCELRGETVDATSGIRWVTITGRNETAGGPELVRTARLDATGAPRTAWRLPAGLLTDLQPGWWVFHASGVDAGLNQESPESNALRVLVL